MRGSKGLERPSPIEGSTKNEVVTQHSSTSQERNPQDIYINILGTDSSVGLTENEVPSKVTNTSQEMNLQNINIPGTDSSASATQAEYEAGRSDPEIGGANGEEDSVSNKVLAW